MSEVFQIVFQSFVALTRAKARNVSFDFLTLYGGQFTLSTQLIILNYPNNIWDDKALKAGPFADVICKKPWNVVNFKLLQLYKFDENLVLRNISSKEQKN